MRKSIQYHSKKSEPFRGKVFSKNKCRDDVKIATTNSYAIHRDRLRPFGAENRFVDLHQLACKIAVSARDNHGYGLVVVVLMVPTNKL